MARRSVYLLLGTHKGAFALRATAARERWRLEGPWFAGTDVNHVTMDTRQQPTLHVAVNSPWWGPGVRSSRDMGATWDEPESGVKFAGASAHGGDGADGADGGEGAGNTVARIWQITAGPASMPGVLYAGVDPAALFRSEDGGRNWAEIPALTAHPTRDQWNPGAGGMMVHSIVPHPADSARVYVGISAAGTFETPDGGATWKPRNQGVLADFMPEGQQYPEVGQCVHHLAAHPARPEVLYQQNHCGVYRSDDGGMDWTDISDGLPARFGFPLLIHPHDPDTVYVIPEGGPETRAMSAVYRSRDRGAHWKRLAKGIPTQDAFLHVYRQGLTADPLEPAGIYFGTSTGQLFASFDGGDSWQLLRDMLPPIYSVEAVAL